MNVYRKRPVSVEAREFDGSNGMALCQWMHDGGVVMASYLLDGSAVLIPTLEGTMRADVGDWIICGIKGEFYPCKPDVFAATYELVE